MRTFHKTLPILAVAALSLACVASAGAALPAPALTGSFGSFAGVQGVAVDQSSGDVYVAAGDGSISKFNATGEPVDFAGVAPDISGNQITGVGFRTGGGEAEIAVDPNSGELYATSGNSILAFKANGEAGSFSALSSNEITGFSKLCGVAVDANGDIYAADFEARTVSIFAASGAPLASFSTTEPCSLAVDSHGAVYVNHWHGAVEKFAASAFPVTPSTTYASVGLIGSSELFPAEVLGGVAVNPADDHVLIGEGTRVLQFGASGSTVGLRSFGSLASAPFGIAVDGASGNVYVPDAGGGSTVDIFSTAPAGKPIVDSQTVSSVDSTSGELKAEINPDLVDTRYYFEYGTDTTYGGGKLPNATGVPIGEGEEDQPAHVAVGGLQPATVYHYRAVATNQYGTTMGLDHTFTTYPSASFALPDNRAWELVSPQQKNSGNVEGIDRVSGGGVVQASADGSAVTYVSLASFENPVGAAFGSQYLSTRSQGGWRTQNMTAPTASNAYGLVGSGTPYRAFSEDLSEGLMLNGVIPLVNQPLPGSGAPQGIQNFYLHDSQDGAFHALITSTPEEGGEVEFAGASPDLKHIIIETAATLTPGAVYNGKPNLYEWTDGRFYPINVLPGAVNNKTEPVAFLGYGEYEGHAVSDDGSRVVWRGGRNLYLREDIGTSEEHTVQIDAPAGLGKFRDASSNGERIYFTDGARLTGDSTAGGGEVNPDLYEYQPQSSTLNDLSVDSNPVDVKGATVQGVLGSGEADGSSYVYFVAQGALPQALANGRGERPASGALNLYVSHDGNPSPSFIADLANSDKSSWNPALSERTARVTPDGRHLVFTSHEALTGADTAGFEEVYLYDAHSASLTCVSCNLSGAQSTGDSEIPGGTQFSIRRSAYQSRVLSDDGKRVFFDSSDALVPQDINGEQDVYEWENGRIYLLSGGTNSRPSEFVDASSSGDDVFFLTAQPLAPQDEDDLFDIYDARVNGGVPEAPTEPSCSGTGCQGPPPTPPIFASPATSTFSGTGNLPGPAINSKSKKLVKCAKGKKLARGKCIKTKVKNTKVKSRHRAKGKRANNNGRAGR